MSEPTVPSAADAQNEELYGVSRDQVMALRRALA